MTGVFYRLWLRERDDHARTRAALAGAVAELDATREVLACTRTDLEAHRRHWALAIAQRDTALDLAAAVVAERAWTAGDSAWLGEHGVGPA